MSQETPEDHLRKIFNFCDEDLDGVISIEDLRRRKEIQEFGEPMTDLLERLDPNGTGKVSLDSFVVGIQSFLGTDDQPLRRESTPEKDTSDTEECLAHSNVYSNEEVLSAPNHSQILIGDLESSSEGSEDNDERLEVIERTIPFGPPVTRILSKKSKSGPLHSTELRRARYESDLCQVAESKVLSLEKENEVLLSRQQVLANDNIKLKENLDVLEDKLQELQRLLENEQKEREREKSEWMKRFNTGAELEMLRSELSTLCEKNESLKTNESDIKGRLERMKEEVKIKDEQLEDLRIRLASMESKTARSEEIWRRERELMKRENDELLQELQDVSQQKERIRDEMEQVSAKRRSTSMDTDFTKEIRALNKEIDRLKEQNAKLTVDLLQQGKMLISNETQSLGSELETASRDKLMSTVKETEAYNQRLRHYIDSLLANIMEKHPELLEINAK